MARLAPAVARHQPASVRCEEESARQSSGPGSSGRPRSAARSPRTRSATPPAELPVVIVILWPVSGDTAASPSHLCHQAFPHAWARWYRDLCARRTGPGGVVAEAAPSTARLQTASTRSPLGSSVHRARRGQGSATMSPVDGLSEPAFMKTRAAPGSAVCGRFAAFASLA